MSPSPRPGQIWYRLVIEPDDSVSMLSARCLRNKHGWITWADPECGDENFRERHCDMWQPSEYSAAKRFVMAAAGIDKSETRRVERINEALDIMTCMTIDKVRGQSGA